LSVATPVSREGAVAVAHPDPAATRRRRSRWWLELLAIGWLAWVYDATTNLAPLRWQQALANGRGVLHLERSLNLDPERALNHWLAAHHSLAVWLSDYYDNAHWGLTLGLLGWLWWRRADLYPPLRNALVLTNVFAFVVFWRYPVAPPRLLPGFSDVVSSTHAFLDSHDGPLASSANQLAAMPSLHMAWAAWCALAVWRMSERRWVRALAASYPCVTAFAVLATGNHYLLDLLAGLATLGVALLVLAVPRPAAAAWRHSARARARWRRRVVRPRRAPAPAPRTPLGELGSSAASSHVRA
jgi:hypothetical protein